MLTSFERKAKISTDFDIKKANLSLKKKFRNL